ncbi:MAG: hypothetical protein JNM18_06730 [Planctomycetaceae bacterium]|nr:hypothetical protein [Planctomycetaceae bacterium]
MAKSKFKLDSKALQAWFNLHAEKLGLAVCGIIFLWMGYTSWSLPKYTKTPQSVKSQIDSASNRIQNADKDWNRVADGITLPNPPYADQVNVALKELDSKPFEWAVAFNRPLIEDRSRRGEPKYLPPLELRTAFHQGAIRGGEGSTGAGHLWNVVTAVLPLKDQGAEYDKQFKASILPFDPARDTPKYADFVIERAEVVNGTAQAWAALNLDNAFEKSNSFTNERTDIVDAKELESFSEPVLHALPPLIEPVADATYLHEPQIKRAVGPVKAAAPVAAAGKTRRRPGEAAPAAIAAVVEQPAAEAVKPVDFKLFRFCDFTVERGKTYRYRVKVSLFNANYKLDPIALAKPTLAQGEFRETPWSEPSNDVIVPYDYQLALAEVRAPASGQEPLARFMTIRFAEKFGVMAGHVHGEFPKPASNIRTFERGTRVHFPSVAGKVRQPGTGNLVAGTVDYPFNGVLLGIAGGNESRRGTNTYLKTPGEALFVWPDGRLQVCNQAIDGALVNSLENPVPPAGAVAGAVENVAEPAPGANPMPPTGKDAGKDKDKDKGKGTIDFNKLLNPNSTPKK